jgi:hypothetical protein
MNTYTNPDPRLHIDLLRTQFKILLLIIKRKKPTMLGTPEFTEMLIEGIKLSMLILEKLPTYKPNTNSDIHLPKYHGYTSNVTININPCNP